MSAPHINIFMLQAIFVAVQCNCNANNYIGKIIYLINYFAQKLCNVIVIEL